MSRGYTPPKNVFSRVKSGAGLTSRAFISQARAQHAEYKRSRIQRCLKTHSKYLVKAGFVSVETLELQITCIAVVTYGGVTRRRPALMTWTVGFSGRADGRTDVHVCMRCILYPHATNLVHSAMLMKPLADLWRSKSACLQHFKRCLMYLPSFDAPSRCFLSGWRLRLALWKPLCFLGWRLYLEVTWLGLVLVLE